MAKIGGARAGSGRKAGGKNKATLKADEVRVVMRETLVKLIEPELESMIHAQAAHAKGVSYMVLRHRDGTFTRATDEKQIDAAVASGSMSFQIFTQAPNPQAFVALLDRTIGKPSEHVEVSGEGGGPLIVKWQE